jgi:transposase
MIIMDSKTQLKADIVAKVAEGKLTIFEAKTILKKSYRTIERYLKKYREEGICFAVHKNYSREPVNKISNESREVIQRLIKDKYYDLNLTHLREKLSKNEDIEIKRETLRTIAHQIEHVKRAKRRRAKVRKMRERMSSPGLLLQMDGSTHRWFEYKKSCLITLIDDADSSITASFFPSETTHACMTLIKELIHKKGVFKTLYVDRAGIYKTQKRTNFTQFERACSELGIQVIYAYSPQAKGRVERAFDTFQDRLIPELRLNNVKTIEEANKFLKNNFIPNYWNKKIVIPPTSIESFYSDKFNSLNIEEAFTLKYYRKVFNDHTFSYENKKYLIESDIKFSISNQSIEIRIDLQENTKFYYRDLELEVVRIKNGKKKFLKEKLKGEVKYLEKETKESVFQEALKEEVEIDDTMKDSVIRQIFNKLEVFPSLQKILSKDESYDGRRVEKPLERKIILLSIEDPHKPMVGVVKAVKRELGLDYSRTGMRRLLVRNNAYSAGRRLEIRNQLIAEYQKMRILDLRREDLFH